MLYLVVIVSYLERKVNKKALKFYVTLILYNFIIYSLKKALYDKYVINTSYFDVTS